MKELKFRAWDGEDMYIPEIQENEQGENINDWFTSFRNVTLMQYTGLKDKNGKEIWEGDVVRIQFPSNPNGTDEITVATIIETFRGLQFLGHGSSTEVRVKNPECLEIIGNIYENPELIK